MSREIYSEHLLLHGKLDILAEVSDIRKRRRLRDLILELLELEEAYLIPVPLLRELLSPAYGIVANRHHDGTVPVYIVKSTGPDQRLDGLAVELSRIDSGNESVYVPGHRFVLSGPDDRVDYALADILDGKQTEAYASFLRGIYLAASEH